MKIIYRASTFLIIDKPSGLIVHPKDWRDNSPSVASWLLKHYPKIEHVGDHPRVPSPESRVPILRPGIVHRLDKETSGVMVIAKTQEMFDYLKKQFQERIVQKTYIALVHGLIKKDSGIIDAPLGKIGTKQTTKLTGKRNLKPRDAITKFTVLQRFPHFFESQIPNPVSLLEVRPQTGRMHQIRVHLNHINNPIVCDPLYGGRRKICPPLLGRLFLHASELSFQTLDGNQMTFKSELPDRLQAFLHTLSS